ncbi:MAG: class I SAM-dependent methyltransferase [Candidatus Acidiferrales bacterium]
MANSESDKILREEFNRWAEAGRGAGMENDHWPITRPALARMRIAPSDRVLDLGCGSGWLARAIAEEVPAGRVAGMDISDQMIRLAREASAAAGQKNVEFVTGEVGTIPWDANAFEKIISVESAYYWPEPDKGVREMHRVARGGGSAWILINYYRDNPHSQQWGKTLQIPTHLLSAEEWSTLFREAGFLAVAHEQIPDPTPNPEVYTGRWFRDVQQLAEFRATGALLVHGMK